MAGTGQQARERGAHLGEVLSSRLRERPYSALGLALMAGYLAGGGLFSPFTRPLARAALGALLVPGVRDRLRGWTGDLRWMQETGAA